MIALVLLVLIVSFAISSWAAMEAIRDNNDLRRRLAEAEAQKNPSSASGAD